MTVQFTNDQLPDDVYALSATDPNDGIETFLVYRIGTLPGMHRPLYASESEDDIMHFLRTHKIVDDIVRGKYTTPY